MQPASSTLGCTARSKQGAAQQHTDGAACAGAEARRAHLRGVPGLAGLSALADAGAAGRRPRGEDAHAEDDDDLLYPDLSPDEPSGDELEAGGHLRHGDTPRSPPFATAHGGGRSPQRERPHDERAGGGLRAAPDSAPAAPLLRPALRAQIMALLWTCWEVRAAAQDPAAPGWRRIAPELRTSAGMTLCKSDLLQEPLSWSSLVSSVRSHCMYRPHAAAKPGQC